MTPQPAAIIEPVPTSTRRGRPPSNNSKPAVEAVKVSKGTWAFRLRWRYAPNDRPIVYVDRVSDEVYELIRKDYYDEYKDALRQNYKGTVPARNASA